MFDWLFANSVDSVVSALQKLVTKLHQIEARKREEAKRKQEEADKIVAQVIECNSESERANRVANKISLLLE